MTRADAGGEQGPVEADATPGQGGADDAEALAERVVDRVLEEFATSSGGRDGLAGAIEQVLRGDKSRVPLTSATARARVGQRLVEELLRLEGRERRDPLGLVLTPPSVASRLAQMLLDVFPEACARARVVLDPCVGTGRLLHAARAVLGDGETAEHDATRYIGWEIDPAVVSLARAIESASELSDDGCRIDERDSLALEVGRPAEADDGELLILCNPPYASGYARGSLAAELDVDQLEQAAGQWGSGLHNALIAFVARIVRDWLEPGEVAGLIVPDAFLNSPRYHAFRDQLFASTDRLVVTLLDDSTFQGRHVRPALIALRVAEQRFVLTGASDVPEPSLERVEFLDADGAGVGEVPIELVRRMRGRTIPWPTDELALVDALQRTALPRLGVLFEIRDGVNTGPREARDRLLADDPRELIRPRPLARGRDVQHDGSVHPSLWIETAPGAIRRRWAERGTSLRDPALFEGPRVYSRQTSARLIAAYADDDSLALNSLHVWKVSPARGEVDASRELRILAAVLNAPIVSTMYQALFAEDRQTFPQIKIANLRELPMPWPPPEQLQELALAVAAGTASDRSSLDAALAQWIRGVAK